MSTAHPPGAGARDWESHLRATRFDLPDASWDRIESRLRARLAEAGPPPPQPAALPVVSPAWLRILLLTARPLAYAGSAAFVLLLAFLVLRQPAGQHAPVAAVAGWNEGDVFETDSQRTWNWQQGRAEIALEQGAVRLEQFREGKARLRLERGKARFEVEHRAQGEEFQVAFGSCRLQVVGTSFSIDIDSNRALARVLTGRVRFFDAQGRDVALLGPGKSYTCGAQGSRALADTADTTAIAPNDTSSVALPASEPSAPANSPRLSADAAAFAAAERSCRGSESAACAGAMRAYLESHPTGRYRARAGLAWGESSQARGDYRDALLAYELAAQGNLSEPLSREALLQASILRISQLRQNERALADLQRVAARAPAGSRQLERALFWSARAAESLGDAGRAATFDSLRAAAIRKTARR